MESKFTNENGLKKIERKYAWSFLGFILALIFGIITIYSSFFKSERPDLDFIILSNTSVLDINERVQELEIKYKNENIIKNNKNLSILTIKIINSSRIDILRDYYDPKNLLGMSISNATLVEKPEIIDASVDYLTNNIDVSIDSNNNFYFSQVIIDRDEFFTVKLLLLHKSNEKPLIKPIGKIAGVKKIDIVNLTDKNKNSFINIFGQNNIIKSIVFIIALIVFALFITGLTLYLGVFLYPINVLKRKINVIIYKNKRNIEPSIELDYIFKLYIYGSKNTLINIQWLLRNTDVLKDEFKLFMKKIENNLLNTLDFVGFSMESGQCMNVTESLVGDLYRNEIIKIHDDNFLINDNFKSRLDEFISYMV